MINLDDTSHCPVATDCEVCDGMLGALLTVTTVQTPVGVYCVTICETCEDNGSAPAAVGWASVVDRVMRHCGHLGIDADQMAAAMAEEG